MLQKIKSIWKKISSSSKFWIGLSAFFCVALIVLGIAAGRLVISAFTLPKNRSEEISDTRKLNFQNSEDHRANSADLRENTEVLRTRRRIDGVYVAEGGENYFPFSVMIENHVDARPQAGLARANLVYEAEAEGGITRFLAFFASGEKIDKIGPVRSARPYYLDWAEELGALYVHCGGSPDALALILKNDIYDLNEFYRSRYFWRDSFRSAPHNVYTSSEKISEYLDANGSFEGNYEPWIFKDDAPNDERGTSSDIFINFKGPNFIVNWIYEASSNSYRRENGGAIHKDENNETIYAKNVIIEFVNSYPNDEKGRMSTQTTGSGKGLFCFDGICREGEWRKAKAAERTKFMDVQNKEVVFNAGVSWIEVVPRGYAAGVKK